MLYRESQIVKRFTSDVTCSRDALLMRHLRVPRWWYRPLGLVGAFAVLLVAGCHGPYPQSTLEPRGDFSQMVDSVFMKTVYLATIVFILVEGALLWAVFKFRGKPDDPQPHQIHGSTVVEIVWTIIPAVVLAIVAVPTVQTIFATAKVPMTSADGQPPLKVEVIGHQWFWEFRYPELGITTANELHVPVNRTVDLRMKSFDVIHAFWVPQFAGKRDIFPNRETRLWFTAKVTGEFPGACAEFCGDRTRADGLLPDGRLGRRVQGVGFAPHGRFIARHVRVAEAGTGAAGSACGGWQDHRGSETGRTRQGGHRGGRRGASDRSQSR